MLYLIFIPLKPNQNPLPILIYNTWWSLGDPLITKIKYQNYLTNFSTTKHHIKSAERRSKEAKEPTTPKTQLKSQ